MAAPQETKRQEVSLEEEDEFEEFEVEGETGCSTQRTPRRAAIVRVYVRRLGCPTRRSPEGGAVGAGEGCGVWGAVAAWLAGGCWNEAAGVRCALNFRTSCVTQDWDDDNLDDDFSQKLKEELAKQLPK